MAGKIFITIFAAKFSDMAIKLLSAKQFATKLKATIQASGRLGFTADTATALGLESGKFARFAQDDENGSLYLIINSERSEDAFEIRVSSGYYYVPTKVMFDTLGYDYENGNVMFDLVRQPSLDDDLQGQVYFMKQRPIKNKEKKNDLIVPWKKAPHILQNETGRTQGTGLCQFSGLREAGPFFQNHRGMALKQCKISVFCIICQITTISTGDIYIYFV